MSQENSPEENQETEKSDDLDTLLKEYETEETVEKTTEKEDPDRYSALEKRLNEMERDNIRKETHQALAEAVAKVKSFGELEMDDLLVEGVLHKLAADDPRLIQAFQNRGRDPQGFNQVLKKVAETIKTKSVRPDPKLSEDSEAVRAAVRGQHANTQEDDKPDAAKLRDMSDAEFAAYKRSLST